MGRKGHNACENFGPRPFFFVWPHLLLWQSPQLTMLTKSRIPKQGGMYTKVKLAPYLFCAIIAI
jgi:hypothetical protein